MDCYTIDRQLISIWIGGNDLCSDGTSPESYETELRAAIDFIGQNIPRTFVNMIQVIDVGSLYDIDAGSIGCNLVRPAACGLPNSASGRAETTARAQGYWKVRE
jgi:hypothetical protein